MESSNSEARRCEVKQAVDFAFDSLEEVQSLVLNCPLCLVSLLLGGLMKALVMI